MNIAGLHLEKPIMNASGTLSKENLNEVKDLYGALVTKTVTLEPRTGNPPPRIAEVSCGMINNIGLQNIGIDRFLEEELGEWDVGLPVIVSIGGDGGTDYFMVARSLRDDPRVAAIEINASCPNIESGRTHCSDPKDLADVIWLSLQGVEAKKPLIVKLALENCIDNASLAEGYGASAVALINSIPALTRLPYGSEPLLGGLSGPAIKPIALRVVYEVSRVVGIPLIASGGIAGPEDIEDFMELGASAVQIGSASFVREPQEVSGKFGVS